MERKQTDVVVTGLKYLDGVLPLLERLRDVGCARDRAGNRELRMPQYVGMVLLSFFNPTLATLRGLQQASQLEWVQRKLGGRRLSLGALSEAGRVFDPAQLEGIIGELLAQLPGAPLDANLSDLRHRLTAVDGTLLKALPQITQACYATRRDQGWKLHTHFDVGKRIPTRMTLTNASDRGANRESAVLRAQLEPDHCYLLDRGYEEFALFNAISAARSSYVARLRAARQFTPEDTRPLSRAAREAGVIEDAVGHLGSGKSRRAEPIDHRVRRIVVLVPWTPSRSGKPHTSSSKPASGLVELVLVTNLCDVPAEIIAVLYRYRWTIELFFRFFKQVLGCKHLLSQHPRGIQLQAYCALIACLLIGLIAGRNPSRRTFEMICLYFQGWATQAELLRHLEQLPKGAKIKQR
jgi:hypothetical protein